MARHILAALNKERGLTKGIGEPDPPRLKDVLTSVPSYKRQRRATDLFRGAQRGRIRPNHKSESDRREVEHDPPLQRRVPAGPRGRFPPGSSPVD